MQRTIRLAPALPATDATIGAMPRAAWAQGASVASTPDSRIDIFAVSATGLTPMVSVPVRLKPVAVNARTDAKVCMAHLLSDSVSLVDVQANPPRVVRTSLVGAEPRDLVFAGPNNRRACVTAGATRRPWLEATASSFRMVGR